MNTILILICSIILPVWSFNEITTKFCINCKFFKNTFMMNPTYGKCVLFPKTERSIDYFITGVDKKVEFFYCSIARKYDDMCGKDGKMYINK